MYPQQSIVMIEVTHIRQTDQYEQYLGPQTVANMAATVVDPIFVVFGILLIPGKFIDTSDIV